MSVEIAEVNPFGERIKRMIKRRGSQRAFVAASGISIGTIYKAVKKAKGWEDFNTATLEGLARGLGMEKDELIAELDRPDDDLPPGSNHDPFADSDVSRAGWISMIGNVAAGGPSNFELDVFGEKNLPPCLYNSPGEYPAAILAKGDSMSPLIDDGDVVIIARRFRRPPEDGDVVAVSLVQEAGHTIKRLEILPDGRWSLVPVNEPKYARRAYRPEQIKAAAVVVGWYHPVHRPPSKGQSQ